MSNRMYYLSTVFLIILTAAVSGVLGFFTGRESLSTSNTQSALIAPLSEQKKVWGQSFDIGDALFLTINRPEEIQGEGAVRPSEGHRLVRSRITLDNKGPFTADFNHIWSRLTLLTSDLRVEDHPLTFGVTTSDSNPKAAVIILPGQSAQGYITYELAQSVQVESITFIGEKIKVIFGQ